MEGSTIDAERLDAALVAIEDRFVWDVPATLRTAIALEEAAREHGAEELIVRAQVCQANMRFRLGDVAQATRQLWEVDKWAIDHDRPMVRARVHLVLAAIHRHLGDPAGRLEHAVGAAEYLDDTATVHAQIWHRVKLADALAETGSLSVARNRYEQAEQLASSTGERRLHMAVLNNRAYAEYCAGAHVQAREVADRLQAMAARYSFELDPQDLDTIACIQIENGLFADAERTLRTCIALHAEGHHDDADPLAEYLLTLARAQRGLGATDRAQSTLDECRALCVQRELADVLARVEQEQAELHAARGEYAEAYAVHKLFFAAHERLSSAHRDARARTRQAMFETAEARAEADRFREQARRDPLTGLRNRRFVDEQLPALIADPRAPLTIALLDLDHFKRVNDQLSHTVGDRVLVAVARLLESELAACSELGFVARIGGEEFLLVLPCVQPAEAVARLEAVRAAVRSNPWGELTGDLAVTVSIGVASTEDLHEPSQAALLATADRNLYVAKHGGRDKVVFGGETSRRVAPDEPDIRGFGRVIGSGSGA